MTFPLAQFFAIYTLVTILQQFHAIGTSPGMQLLLGATILLNVVSSIVLLYFMRKMYQKEQEEQRYDSSKNTKRCPSSIRPRRNRHPSKLLNCGTISTTRCRYSPD